MEGTEIVPSFILGMLVHQVEEIVRQIFASDHAYSDCFLLEVSWKKPRLLVYFDADSGVTLQKCQTLSRLIESELDENSAVTEPYTLEVSSGGLERPLKFHRQYVKNLGRLLKINLIDGRELTGKLLNVTDDALELELIVPKQHPKKATVNTVIEVLLSDIKTSLVQISI